MYENMTVISNREYAELVIKAHKYELLRKNATGSSFVTSDDVLIFEITKNELDIIHKRREKHETV